MASVRRILRKTGRKLLKRGRKRGRRLIKRARKAGRKGVKRRVRGLAARVGFTGTKRFLFFRLTPQGRALRPFAKAIGL